MINNRQVAYSQDAARVDSERNGDLPGSPWLARFDDFLIICELRPHPGPGCGDDRHPTFRQPTYGAN
jgi:hypothetical protein